MGYASQGRSISRVFDDLGFRPDDMINGFFGDRRLVYYEGKNRFHVDVFLDKLEFSHDVLFGKKPGTGRWGPTPPRSRSRAWSPRRCRSTRSVRKISVTRSCWSSGTTWKPPPDGVRV